MQISLCMHGFKVINFIILLEFIYRLPNRVFQSGSYWMCPRFMNLKTYLTPKSYAILWEDKLQLSDYTKHTFLEEHV